jgi:hypothetical protein
VAVDLGWDRGRGHQVTGVDLGAARPAGPQARGDVVRCGALGLWLCAADEKPLMLPLLPYPRPLHPLAPLSPPLTPPCSLTPVPFSRTARRRRRVSSRR